jgi:hypothetical protein
VTISAPENGADATVDITEYSITHHYSVSTMAISGDDRCIIVRDSYRIEGEDTEHEHKCQTADDALRIIMEAVGKHIASQEVFRERRKPSKTQRRTQPKHAGQLHVPVLLATESSRL